MRIGDLVWTMHDGYQPANWIGRTEVAAEGAFAPVVVPKGVFGNTHELVISQEHRLLVRAAQAELLFGETDVLIAAKHLCGFEGIHIRTGGTICYVHVMFDEHQIVETDGVLSESFFLTRQSLSGLERHQTEELLALFPSLEEHIEQFGRVAARTLKRHEASLLVDHMTKHAA